MRRNRRPLVFPHERESPGHVFRILVENQDFSIVEQRPEEILRFGIERDDLPRVS